MEEEERESERDRLRARRQAMEEEERERERERLRARRQSMEEEERESERDRLRARRQAMEEEERERERLRARRQAMEEAERERERERVREQARRRRQAMDEEDRLMEQEENTRQHQLHQASQSSETAPITRANTLRQQRRRASTPPSTGNYMGPMTAVCHHCQALRFPSEALNCCHTGKVSLPALANYPQPLEELFTGTSTEARNFRENIRKYNSAFSFAQTVQVSLIIVVMLIGCP